MALFFEWDENKNRSNLRKHGVKFEEAAAVFEDPQLLIVRDRVQDGEERWHAIGMVEGCLVLTVAHTLQEEDGSEVIRIISARSATRRERRRYESQDS